MAAAAKEDYCFTERREKKGKVVGMFISTVASCIIVYSFFLPRYIDDTTRSLEVLWRNLQVTSLRPKLACALVPSDESTPSQLHPFPALSLTSPASLDVLPSCVTLTNLTEDELVKRAQIVDTALFKSYLGGRPSMLGPFCRLRH
jgi:Vam6/Vps39-like protein vacuolar protein sorting-associated protein 39